MKTVGIAIDSWKLPIFKRHLDDAGFSFSSHPGLTSDSMILKVRVDLVAPLQRVIWAAQRECRAS